MCTQFRLIRRKVDGSSDHVIVGRPGLRELAYAAFKQSRWDVSILPSPEPAMADSEEALGKLMGSWLVRLEEAATEEYGWHRGYAQAKVDEHLAWAERSFKARMSLTEAARRLCHKVLADLYEEDDPYP